MKKIVLTLYTSHNAGPDIPFSNTKYQHCYETFYTLAETLGIHLCRAPLDWYDTEADQFRDAWEYVDATWRRSGPIKPDLVYDRTNERSMDDPTRALIISRYPFLDSPEFTKFANNKYETSRLLPQFFKPYQKISSQADFSEFLASYSGNRLVIKPPVGSGGKGVHIVSKEEAAKLQLSFPVIVQEFIDSSHGIPGIVDTYHDLRLVFIGDELVYSYVRVPAHGSFLANLAQGGSMQVVPNTALPKSLQPLIKNTQQLFSQFPQKTYTIDVMFDETGRPWIIEFNTMPGMYFPAEEKEMMLRVYDRLLQEFVHFLENQERLAQRRLPAVILFSPFDGEEKVAFRKKQMRDAYTSFARLAHDNGIDLYRASTKWYDPKTGTFRKGWFFNGTAWRLASHITPEVIYDKAADSADALSIKKLLNDRFAFVNNPRFTLHAGSKLLVSQAFKDFAKPYYIAHSREDLLAKVEQIPGTKVVIKPERGNSGDGVFIVEKSSLAEQTLVLPCLAQEFVDSRAGIPGVMTGLHDLRLIFLDETLLYAYYRTPRPGSYLANVAQGGELTMVEASAIPASVWPAVKTVQQYYAEFSPKIYTIDFIFDPAGTPWIVELNTMPGLYPDKSERLHIEKLYHAIISALKSAANKK